MYRKGPPKKSTTKQAVSVLIKILFAFTGFTEALRHHNKLNSFQYIFRGLISGGVGAYNLISFFFSRQMGLREAGGGGGVGGSYYWRSV